MGGTSSGLSESPARPPAAMSFDALNSRSDSLEPVAVYGELFELQLTTALLRERAKRERGRGSTIDGAPRGDPPFL